MADRFCTEVVIGGPLDETKLNELIGAVSEAGLSIDHEQIYTQAWLLKAARSEIATDAAQLEFSDPEVSNDVIEELTNKLRSLKIPYNVRVDAKYEYDAELRWWRPGLKGEVTWTSMSADCGKVMISLDELKTWRRKRRGLQDVIKFLEQIPPPLPDISWTGPIPPVVENKG